MSRRSGGIITPTTPGSKNMRDTANTRGLSKQEATISEEIFGIIPQYRAAAKELAAGKIYARTSPQGGGYKDLYASRGAAYKWENGELVTICHNTTVRRMRQVVKAYQDFKEGKIDVEVWENYIHNGYNTRRGLYADYNKERLRKIANSHADYAGMETGNSARDHRERVLMRSF